MGIRFKENTFVPPSSSGNLPLCMGPLRHLRTIQPNTDTLPSLIDVGAEVGESCSQTASTAARPSAPLAESEAQPSAAGVMRCEGVAASSHEGAATVPCEGACAS